MLASSRIIDEDWFLCKKFLEDFFFELFSNIDLGYFLLLLVLGLIFKSKALF